MEELESFFEIFFAGIVIVVSLIASAKKAKNQRINDADKQSRMQDQAASQPAPTRKPAQATVLPPMTFPDISIPVASPTVHPHVQPDCNAHDVPGSLGVTSLEGKDPCHEKQLSHARTMDAPSQEGTGLNLEWTGENLVKAFVMQEVLTRPCQRQAR